MKKRPRFRISKEKGALSEEVYIHQGGVRLRRGQEAVTTAVRKIFKKEEKKR